MNGPDPVTGLQRVPARRRSWPRRASARTRGGSSRALPPGAGSSRAGSALSIALVDPLTMRKPPRSAHRGGWPSSAWRQRSRTGPAHAPRPLPAAGVGARHRGRADQRTPRRSRQPGGARPLGDALLARQPLQGGRGHRWCRSRRRLWVPCSFSCPARAGLVPAEDTQLQTWHSKEQEDEIQQNDLAQACKELMHMPVCPASLLPKSW